MGVRAGTGRIAVVVLAEAVDWTRIILEAISIVPALAAAFFAYRVHMAVKTPSGERIGVVSEQTHALASVNTSMLKDVHRATANGEATPEGEAAARR